MSVRLIRTNTALADCEQHLGSTGAFGTVIESYLTQHILVIFCAEVQQLIYEILNNRASLSGDEGLESFVVVSGKRVFRSVQKDSIASLAECFGKDAKDKLNASVDDEDVTIYNNAVRGRHDVAHSYGVTISFQEVKNAAGAAIKILKAFEVAIQPE